MIRIAYKMGAALLAVAAGFSCTIKNDIDAPLIPGDITAFMVEGQQSVSIDKEARTVKAIVSDTEDLGKLRLIKFELSDKASCQDMAEGDVIDLSGELRISVKTYQEYVWTISAAHPVKLDVYVNAYSNRAELGADATDADARYVFEWKKASAATWNATSEVQAADGMVSAQIDGLEPSTAYLARMSENGAYSREVEFETEAEYQIPNMGFDEWHSETLSGNKIFWYPGPAASDGQIWDSANRGVLSIGKVCATTPEEEFLAVPGEGKKAARLESLFPNFFGLGRFAAGNLLTGQFGEAVMSPNIGATMIWGVPFSSRPSELTGWYAYSPKAIDHDDLNKNPDKLGRTDKMQILVLLTDWDSPFTVNTAEGIFVDQENDPNIIAKGVFETSEASFDGEGNLQYVRFSCPLEYRSTTRKPKYIVVNACASAYGDDFTGAVGSLLYIDELEFKY